MSLDLTEDGAGTFAERLSRHYAGITSRLRGPAPAARMRRFLKPVPEPEPVEEEPAPKAATRDFLFVTLPADPEAPERRVLVPQWKVIIHETAKKHSVTFNEIVSPQRSHLIVLARHECCYRMAMETTMSLPQIGRRLGGRDHTTVLHGIRRHAAREGLETSRKVTRTPVFGEGGWH
jgi:hypothetical protein